VPKPAGPEPVSAGPQTRGHCPSPITLTTIRPLRISTLATMEQNEKMCFQIDLHAAKKKTSTTCMRQDKTNINKINLLLKSKQTHALAILMQPRMEFCLV
jgi:hypothetical protein